MAGAYVCMRVAGAYVCMRVWLGHMRACVCVGGGVWMHVCVGGHMFACVCGRGICVHACVAGAYACMRVWGGRRMDACMCV